MMWHPIRFRPTGVSFERVSTGDRYFVPVNWNSGAWTEELSEKLEASGAVYDQIPQRSDAINNVLTYLVVSVVLCVALYFVLRRIGGGAQQNIFALRNSKARVAEESSKVRFEDVGGCVEAKQELTDIVNFLKSPQRWTDAGARLPRGVLLEGPPGCGKTLLARAVAGETNAKFYYTSASEFVEMFIGVGPARVRDMMELSEFVVEWLLWVIPLILSITVHEWAHAASAAWLGDDTARLLGRNTLNPVAHVDPVGTLLLPLMGIPFGWAKPVPINPIRFRQGTPMKLGVLIVAIAGPISNVVLAAVCWRIRSTPLIRPETGLDHGLSMMILLNIGLAVFNMLPMFLTGVNLVQLLFDALLINQ